MTPKQEVRSAFPHAGWIFHENVRCWHVVKDMRDRYSPLLSTPGKLFRSALAAWSSAARRLKEHKRG